MDGSRFDNFSRSVTARIPRRAWVAGLGSGLLAILAPVSGGERLALGAKKKGRKKTEKKSKFLASPMTGNQEVPPESGDPIGQGSASFTSQGKTMCGTFTLSAATSFSVTGTHIHEGAAGVDGPIVVDFGATVGSKVCVNAGSVAKRIKANPAGFYANIHTSSNTGGAVRGQLQRV